jgi:parallel beta-helix repeat protein
MGAERGATVTRAALTYLALTALSYSGCAANDACTGVSGACVALAPSMPETSIKMAFLQAKSKSTIAFAAGTYKFTNSIGLTVDGVTVLGAGLDKTILDFSGQVGASEAISVTASDFTIQGLTVRDTPADSIKVLNGRNVTFRKVNVIWTNPDNTKHGAYGLYPVLCTNVLIEDSSVSGAADAGIYVGQSEYIVVRRSTATNNVAGIEIESSHYADVYDNTATGNAAGFLVFSLPGLKLHDGNTCRVFNNTSVANNGKNFAAPGSTVSYVPAGTGMIVMANRDVEVYKNTFKDNNTGHLAVVSYLVTQLPYMDDSYNPYPHKVYIHDNTFSGGGTMPDPSRDIGLAFFLQQPKFPDMRVPDIVWDGLVDPMYTVTRPMDPMDICLGDNGTVNFANLHADTAGATGFPDATYNATPFKCMLTPLAPVTWPGLGS